MRIVVALGGNDLLRRGEKPDAAFQLGHVQAAAEALQPLAALHDVVICHGNGPQIGLLALESQADASLTRPYPLDVLNAQTQGMIGYWLAQALRNAGVHNPIISLVTRRSSPAQTRHSRPRPSSSDRSGPGRLPSRWPSSTAGLRPVTVTVGAVSSKNFGKPDALPLRRLGLDELAGMQFAAGSMGPKIEACRRFVSRTGRPAAIGGLTDAAAVLRGGAGTTITAPVADGA